MIEKRTVVPNPIIIHIKIAPFLLFKKLKMFLVLRPQKINHYNKDASQHKDIPYYIFL